MKYRVEDQLSCGNFFVADPKGEHILMSLKREVAEEACRKLNAHQPMVEALEAAIDPLLCDLANDWRSTREALDKVRSALALAKGEAT